jgi:hypothetical protein
MDAGLVGAVNHSFVDAFMKTHYCTGANLDGFIADPQNSLDRIVGGGLSSHLRMLLSS